MIITLKGANFASSNIGTLDSWLISKSLTGVTIDNTVTSVKKGEAYKAVITLKENYTFPDTITVTMAGTDITSTYVTKTATTITIDIPSVTGNIVIRVNATSNVVGATYSITYDLKGYTSSNKATTITANEKYSSTMSLNKLSSITTTPTTNVSITMGGKTLVVDTDYSWSDMGSGDRYLNINNVTGNLVIRCEAFHSVGSATVLDSGKWPSPYQEPSSAINYYPTITSDSSKLQYIEVPQGARVYTYANDTMITGTSEYPTIVLTVADYVVDYYQIGANTRSYNFKAVEASAKLYYNSSTVNIMYFWIPSEEETGGEEEPDDTMYNSADMWVSQTISSAGVVSTSGITQSNIMPKSKFAGSATITATGEAIQMALVTYNDDGSFKARGAWDSLASGSSKTYTDENPFNVVIATKATNTSYTVEEMVAMLNIVGVSEESLWDGTVYSDSPSYWVRQSMDSSGNIISSDNASYNRSNLMAVTKFNEPIKITAKSIKLMTAIITYDAQGNFLARSSWDTPEIGASVTYSDVNPFNVIIASNAESSYSLEEMLSLIDVRSDK